MDRGGHDQGAHTPFVHAPRRPKAAAFAEEAIPADGDGSVVCRSSGGRAARRDDGAGEVAADHDLLLDDGLAAEHDVLRTDQGGLASDLVARVLERGKLGVVRRRSNSPSCNGSSLLVAKEERRTVSMYSPLGALLDMLAAGLDKTGQDANAHQELETPSRVRSDAVGGHQKTQ